MCSNSVPVTIRPQTPVAYGRYEGGLYIWFHMVSQKIPIEIEASGIASNGSELGAGQRFALGQAFQY